MTGTLPRPAFDPELDAVLVVLADQLPPTLTAEMIPSMRQPTPANVTWAPAAVIAPPCRPLNRRTPAATRPGRP